MGSVDGLLSPESTVTSLLASSGRLRSSLHPEPVHTIKYNDRNYESASEALDAYIADFHRSLQTSEATVGQLELPKEPVTPRLHLSGYRNRDVLKERLTQRELDFLKLPVGSKRRDSDHLSVTTDDLLLLPSDGTLPVTRTSAFLSRSERYRLGHRSNSSSQSRLMPSAASLSSLHRSQALRTERSLRVDDLLLSRSRTTSRTLPSSSFLSTRTNLQHTQEKSAGTPSSLPRWITSHKSEMDFSGVTSIPDLKYPVWLREYETDLTSEVSKVPSWIAEQGDNTSEGFQHPNDLKHGQTCSDQTTLGELRLQFSKTPAAAKSGENTNTKFDNEGPFRGDRIGSLIQRAEQVLNTPSLGLCDKVADLQLSPGGSEELLEAERSWDNPPVTFKSPVPVGDPEEQLNTEESQKDATEKSIGSSSGYSSRRHHGPVEALKQMLFSLQAVEQRVSQQKEAERHSGTVPDPQTQQENRELTEVPEPEAEDYDSAPGGQSLQRALHHLGRLKSLVEELNQKKSRELQQRGGTEHS
ncbi:lung adenoma susceptibility protein 2 [Hoplias malabaricus]|uniref:lung adenoma susceptibility protein 2 n=1 Tax=Hoplias malabaricus TaxID=27720 RepID=UPI0034634C1D